MRFALRRLGFFLLTLWAALTLNFVLPRLMPGNPALAILGRLKGGASPQALRVIEQQFGIGTHQNVVAQYFGYLGNVATFRFGTSLTTQPGASVGRIILNAIPWTLGLVGVTTVLAFVLGTGIGILAAWGRGSWLDTVMPPFFVIMTVIPFFWLGLILILIFGVKLHVHADPLPHAVVHRQRGRARHPAGVRLVAHDDRHLDSHHAQHHDHHAGRGLRAHGPG
jgi:peptide/nickel transport system permease protein